MKPDVLTITTIIFVAGVLISGLGMTESIGSQPNDVPPSVLQQGIAER